MPMKLEVRSIFTSQKEFSSQSEQRRQTPPHSDTLVTPATSASAATTSTYQHQENSNIRSWAHWADREACLQAEQQEPAPWAQRVLGLASRNVPVANGDAKQDQPPPSPTTPNVDSYFPPIDYQRVPTQTPNIPRSSAATSTNASKHKRTEDIGKGSSSERPKKKSKRPELMPEPFPTGFHFNHSDAISPLFFSHSPGRRQRPALPPGVSSTEAVIMLNKAVNESAGITTLKLARGSVSQAKPRASSTPGSWASLERSSIPQSPDVWGSKQSGLQILGNVGVIEFLEQDERPTFIVDVANPLNFNPGVPLKIVFANASLRACDAVLDMVTGKTDLDSPGVAVTNNFPEFKAWVLSFVKDSESLDICLPSFVYGGITWICSTLRKRLRLISGSSSSVSGVGELACPSDTLHNSDFSRFLSLNEQLRNIRPSNGGASNSSVLSERAHGPTSLNSIANLSLIREPTDYFGDATVARRPSASPDTGSPLTKQANFAPQKDMAAALLPSESPSFDWTRLPISAALPRHIQFARSVDWEKTALGPIENWAFDLRAMCNLIMGSPHAAAMYWGPEYIAIYNEAYILLAGQRHPKLMGQSYKTAWAEIWSDLDPYFKHATELGQATMKDDHCLFVTRNGFLEESYFSWSIIPLIGEDGQVVGIYNPVFEKTRRKIAERRMLTLREIGEKTAIARDVKGFWGQVIKGLEYNEYDVPFVFLYSVNDETDSDMSSIYSGSLSQAPQCVLEGVLGVPKDHKAAVSPLDLKSSDEGFAPYLRESMKTSRPILLSTEDGTLSTELIEGLEWRGFGDPCRAAVVCPIHPTTGESILGFLVMGINPRRPYDDDYSLFIQLISRQLATSMASVVLFEEEIRRGQRAARLAALDRQELSKQLHLRTQEAVESETKFTRMAEFAPVGMFIADSHGTLTYSNDTWWEITRHPRAENSANTWMESIKDEDRDEVKAVWKRLVIEAEAVTHEFRFKTPWQDRTGGRSDTWVLMSAYPEKNEDGSLKSVFGSITNISQQKWAEGFQKRRMEEAIEMKRQQENFIDITSHEMRNPLSAILQCADEISQTLSDYRSAEESSRTSQKLDNILESGIDAAQTIALCAQHQKRIVDDILTLSKLDSALLLVTPVDVQPVAVVQRALKMFEGEIETNDIAMEFRVEKSYLDLAVDWVKLDPSRLLQVLINLTTNAIKFTHTQTKRTIVVSIGASKEEPQSGVYSDVCYFPTRSKRGNITTDEAEWGTGEEIYLHFTVQDTGRGLDDNEKKLLFLRFSQASPRTHVQYGGSGLGLFISRELTEMQGGEIGVSSERGIGSTFAFYVKARKVDSIPTDTPIATSLKTLRKTSSNSVTVESRKSSSSKAVHRSTTSRATTLRSSPKPRANSSTNQNGVIKVLVVEDNLVNQRVLQKQLRNQGMEVHVANHGVEALELLKTSRFWSGQEKSGIELSVILMDLEMPIMDGLSCARRIRELETDGTIVTHVPIICVTANARLEQIETAIAAGMDDVVSKPFRIPDLVPKIDELIMKYNNA